jgi:hypothetical protein
MADPTTPTPTTDPALLAAQAKAGQAGVDAYNAALAKLNEQRAQAVQTAMQEAAARGTPSPINTGQVTSGLDQRIADLTQGQAAFKSNMAAREARFGDYVGAVNSARNLIPGQVDLAVAPIRAETAFKVAQIGAQGRQDIDKIDAQTRLMQAQADLAKLAAARSGGGGRGGGGGSGPKVTGTNARNVIKDAAQQLTQAYTAPAQQVAEQAPTRQEASDANMAANYTGRGVAEALKMGYTPEQIIAAQGTGGGQAPANPPNNVFTQLQQGLQGSFGNILRNVASAPVDITKKSTGGASMAQQLALQALQRLAITNPVAGRLPTEPLAQAQGRQQLMNIPTSSGTPAGRALGQAASQIMMDQPGRSLPSAMASAAQMSALGGTKGRNYQTIVAPEGTPYAGHEVGQRETILEPFGIASDVPDLSTLQYPEQQAAARAKLENARAIGQAFVQSAAQQGADLLRGSGTFNIPEADVISSLQALRGTTPADMATEATGGKPLTIDQMFQNAKTDRTAALTQQAADTKTTDAQDDATFANLFDGADLNDTSKAANMNRGALRDYVATNPGLVQAYTNLVPSIPATAKSADIAKAISKYRDPATGQGLAAQAQRILNALMRGGGTK